MTSSDRPAQQEDLATERTITVLVAAAANASVAVAKAVAGVLSGSAAMQAEAAHSAADLATEVFLFIAARRGNRAPDAEHPLGYGRETYLWAFLAALATFTAGAGFSLARGVDSLLRGERQEPGGLLLSYAILAFAFVAEAISLRRGLRQIGNAAARIGLSRRLYLRLTTDTTVKAVIFEDVAALVGLMLAAVGITLWRLTGKAYWDGLASVAVGTLLVIVAASLARTNLSLIAGQAAPPQLQAALRQVIESLPGVRSVPVFVAIVLGPGNVLVAAKVDFADEYSAADIERVADEGENLLRARYPGVRYVFLDPTPSRHARGR